jgi:hypothetical protein
VDDYRTGVPLVTYDELVPWIDRMAHGETDILFEGQPVAFELTGGSTGGRKLIPYSSASLADFAKAIVPWLSETMRRYAVQNGAAYWSISPAARAAQTTAGGLSIGLPDAAYLGDEWEGVFADTNAVSDWVGQLADIETWRLATLYGLVCCSDLRLVSVWSPTFLIMLLDNLEDTQEDLRAVLMRGEMIDGHALVADPAALARYESYLRNKDTRALWPHLRLVSCWADAASRPFYDQLRARMPNVDFQPKGLLLTEGVVTVPDTEGRRVLATDSGFFEFLGDNSETVLAHQLDVGACYEVIMTTGGGLYRYRTGDRVCCTGLLREAPCLQFVGRTTLTSDLVGEKLTEAFVDQCVQHVEGFRMLVPGREPLGYILVVDAKEQGVAQWRLADDIDRALSRNSQYKYARRVGQLAPLRIRKAKAPLHTYLMYLADKGGRLGDIKVPSLRAESYWAELFEGNRP